MVRSHWEGDCKRDLQRRLLLYEGVGGGGEERFAGARAAVLSDDDGGEALADEGFLARVLFHLAVAVRMDVDEARGDGESASVDDLRAAIEVGPDRGDASVENGDVELARGAAE